MRYNVRKTYYPVVISYRDESQGAGAFFDHYTVRRVLAPIIANTQQMPGSPTRITSSPTVREHPMSPTFRREQKNLALPIDANAPDIVDDKLEDCGLLIVPGRARITETEHPEKHRQRQHFEYELIRQALLTGRPILAICAGAWALWNVALSNPENEERSNAITDKTRAVDYHCNRGGMPSLKNDGTVGWNNQLHRIYLTDNDTLLKRHINHAGYENDLRLSVNSVHWLAPNEQYLAIETTRAKIIISAKSIGWAGQGGYGRPEQNSVEAFESQFGAPTIGTLWHPEAYNQNDSPTLYPQIHLNLIKNMIEAGNVFGRKKEMLSEFKTLAKPANSCARVLKKFGIFRNTDDNLEGISELFAETLTL